MEHEVFTGKYLRVTTTGQDEHTYERVYVRPGISVIPLMDDGKIRCAREYDWSQQVVVRIKLVSGYIRDDEEPLACAQRELGEEIGLQAQYWELFLRSTNEEGTVQKIQYYYLARNLRQGQTHPDADERIVGVVDLTLQEVRERALRGEFGTTGTAFALLKLVEQLQEKRV